MTDLRAVDQPGPAVPLPTDLTDERLVHASGLTGWLSSARSRIRGGDLGSLPVVVGLVVISIVFYLQEPAFLSSRSLVTISQFAAPVGIIALGIVLVLLLGEIDLSVGSMSGLAAAIMAVLVVNHGQSMWIGLLAGVLAGVAVGLFYTALYVRVGVPSFVITLAGLLGFQGLLLYVLGRDGTINIPDDSGLVQFARYSFVKGPVAYVLVLAIVALYVISHLIGRRRRKAAGLSAPSVAGLATRAGLLAAGLLFLTYYLGLDRG